MRYILCYDCNSFDAVFVHPGMQNVYVNVQIAFQGPKGLRGEQGPMGLPVSPCILIYCIAQMVQ